jgi:L-lysine 6-oxidase
MTLTIHPSVGVGRLGNSQKSYYLSPTTIGGLPTEPGTGQPVNLFKDPSGCIRRQGQLFKVYDGDDEITLDTPSVASIEWTVHLANKKAAILAKRQYQPVNSLISPFSCLLCPVLPK